MTRPHLRAIPKQRLTVGAWRLSSIDRERETDRERDRETDRQREGERERISVLLSTWCW